MGLDDLLPLCPGLGDVLQVPHRYLERDPHLRQRSTEPTSVRICVEFLNPQELARREIFDLLVSHGVAPMLAAPTVSKDPKVQTEADGLLAQMLALYRKAGLSPCVWPLLAEDDGYWPGLKNADQVVKRVRGLLAAAKGSGAPFERGDFVAIDLEPPFAAAKDAVSGDRHGQLFHDEGPEMFAWAQGLYGGLAKELREAGLRSLAIAYPLVASDHRGAFFGRLCRAPLHCGWDRVSIMTYSSMIAGYSKGFLSVAAARRYGYLAQRRLCELFPQKAGAFVGICGTGKLGNEPAHQDPEALLLDAQAAWAAGAVEVSGFCLEGILAQREPGRWLAALARPTSVPKEGVPAPSLLGDCMHAGLVVTSRIGAWLEPKKAPVP